MGGRELEDGLWEPQLLPSGEIYARSPGTSDRVAGGSVFSARVMLSLWGIQVPCGNSSLAPRDEGPQISLPLRRRCQGQAAGQRPQAFSPKSGEGESFILKSLAKFSSFRGN